MPARRSSRFVVAPLALTSLAVAAALPAAASGAGPGDHLSHLPVAIANPDASDALIASLPDAVQQSDVVLDGGLEVGTPIVYPDGTPVERQGAAVERAAIEAFSSCTGSAWGPPTGQFGPESECRVAVFGHPGYTRLYAFRSGLGAVNDPRGCGQARGFNAQGTRTWYSVGCGVRGDGPVPWGNILSKPAFRAQSTSIPMGVTLAWWS